MLVCRSDVTVKQTIHTPRDLTAATERYVAQTLHAPLELVEWSTAAELPAYLRATYKLMHGALEETPILWLEATEPVTPKTLEKHIGSLKAYWPGMVVTVFRVMPAYVRQRLIQKGIAFVVPGAQLYLPGLGFDYRSRSAAPLEQRDHLRPSTQLLLLHLLHRPSELPKTPVNIALETDYTLMTVSRSVSELEGAGLIEVTKTGRSKLVRLASSPREVWEASQPRLRTPVMRTLTIPSMAWGDFVRPFAGFCALAEYTMLQGPPTPVRAVAAQEARLLDIEDEIIAYGEVDIAENDVEHAQIWSYDPTLLATGVAVDRLSLYLSLRDDSDERVQTALTELLGGMGW